MVSACLLTPKISLAQQASGAEENNSYSEEILRLEQETQLLLRQTQLQTQRNALNRVQLEGVSSGLPTPNANFNPLQGTTTVSGPDAASNLFETQTLAYEALSSITQTMADDILSFEDISDMLADDLDVSLIVYNEDIFNELKIYQTYDSIRRGIAVTYYSQYQIGNPPTSEESGIAASVVGIANAAQAIGQSLIGFISLFRTNRTFTNLGVSIPQEALVSQLNREFINQPSQTSGNVVRVYYPGLYSFEFSNDFANQATGPVTNLLNEINKLQELNQVADQILQGSIVNPDLSSEDIKSLREFHQFSKDFVTALSTVDESSGDYGLVRLARAARLADLISSNETYVLQVDISSGASRQISQNLFTGSRMSHSAGVIANYRLFNNQSVLVLSDTLYYETGYTSGARNNVQR